ncbi:WD40/YVTN/BNR-like repeat-containing protein [Mucilaginibacter sp.]|uniref:WD40/YVTN/BNR-like repeat-containing protein n=1 Tax=Mucilaginibacter sp. TaxID=1882438 RepID=UPI002CA74A15|nr:YCF48-related protein [Mucilaginibacter sp.]HTI58420.1 YCF48-related protein [Mucilaginibacter sp.]
MKKLFYYTGLFLLCVTPSLLKAQHVETLQQGKPASFRGLSVVDDNIAWASGSRGTIAVTADGGKTWDWKQVKGFEKSDFRDIEAFSGKEAIIMSSGTPALILKTTDGGNNWQVKYENTDTAYFFDAMDFDRPKHGLVLGDPIGGKFVMMETNDGGENWHPFKNPPNALPGEAAFAASGTCLRISCGLTYITTGGSAARLLAYHGKKSWDYQNAPLPHSKPSQGGFSFVCGSDKGIMVGGDYAKDKRTDSVSATLLTSSIFTLSEKGPAGFQSCVEYISGNTFLSTGTPGSNITTDSGKTWGKIDDVSYNVCRKAKHGSLVLLAGDKGHIGIFKP